VTRPAGIRSLGRLLMLLLLLGYGDAAVQAAVSPGIQETVSTDKITLNFQEADIRALINTVSQITGKNFIVDPRVKGKVTLISGDKLNVAQVYAVFLSVLQVHNFAAVKAEDGIVKIVPLSLVKQSPTPTSFVTPRPRGDVQITQVYKLKYGSVQEMVPILRPLLPPTSHFAAYAASNTLVFTDTAANIKRILKVIRRIDQPQTEGNLHVVYLRYAKATDLVKLLGKILASKQKAAGPRAKTRPFSVQAEETTNALVVHAPDDDFVFIRDLIDKLDIRRAQVFIEVLIAEVSTDKAQNLGVRWQFGDTNPVTGETTGSTGFSDVTGGLTLGYLRSFVEDLSGTTVPELQVVLSALQTDSNTNILSTPNLLTLDNEAAEIVVGQEVPFITGQYTTTATSTTTTTDTDTGTGTATTAAVNPFQTIQRKEVGLKLKITPQINADNSMRLEIEQELSSISPVVVEGAADLITNTRSIKATVMVDDGQIIVLGGLMNDDLKDTIEWVPVLGKIPLLGALFRKKSKTAVKTNLMVFLRPKVIRTKTDLAGHTKQKYRQMQELEKKSHPDSKHLLYGTKNPVLPDIDPLPNQEKSTKEGPKEKNTRVERRDESTGEDEDF